MATKIQIPQSDIDSLCDGGEIFRIGGTELQIVPLPLQALPGVVRDVMSIRKAIATAITGCNGSYEAAVPRIADLIVERAPGIAAELVGVELASFRALPAGTALDLLFTAFEVNIKASGDMIKKLVALAGKSNELVSVWNALNTDKAAPQPPQKGASPEKV